MKVYNAVQKQNANGANRRKWISKWNKKNYLLFKFMKKSKSLKSFWKFTGELVWFFLISEAEKCFNVPTIWKMGKKFVFGCILVLFFFLFSTQNPLPQTIIGESWLIHHIKEL